MADLRLRDRLQPSLLDRLTDRSRLNSRVRVTIRREEATRHGISVSELVNAFQAQGLRSLEARENDSLEFGLAGSAVQAGSLQSIVLRRQGEAPTIRVSDVADLEVTIEQYIPDFQDEDRTLGLKELRQAVLRDLAWLLNTTNLESYQSLNQASAVTSSVLNYGIASIAGRNQGASDAKLAAESIRRAIQRFEPRLTRVNVTPESTEGPEDGVQAFRLEAELWGQPTPQRITLRTTLDFDRSATSLFEVGGG
jgi:type VI secretion system lysozyme-like protein